MKRTFEHKMDIVDSLEDLKHKVIFLSVALINILKDEDCRPGTPVIVGMQVIIDEIADQISAVSDEIQHNVYKIDERKEDSCEKSL